MECLDARVKLFALVGASIMLFVADGPVCLIVWCLLLVLCAHVSGVRAKDVQGIMRFLVIVLTITLICNTIRLDGSASMRIIGPVGLYPEAGSRVVFAVLRLAYLAGFALCVAKTTDAPEVARACMRLLRPLSAVGVPVYSASVVLSISLRFIPILSDEFTTILAAQRSRGADFDEGDRKSVV